MDLLYRMAGRAARKGPAGVARLLEGAASAHAAALGAGIGDLRERGQAWMLVQLGFDARRWPEEGEAVEILTWPSRRTAGARAWREFEVLSSGGERLVEAASVWLIVDLCRRKPVRLPRSLLELDFPARETPVRFEPLPAPPAAPPRLHRRAVGAADLDINEHVNNVTYLEWAEAAADGAGATRLQIDYVEEARLGEEIRVATWDLPGTRLQRIGTPERAFAWVQWRRQAR